jgi:hypothetical protein
MVSVADVYADIAGLFTDHLDRRYLGEPVTDEFDAGMPAWWARNEATHEPARHSSPETYGLDLEAVRPRFTDYVEHAARWTGCACPATEPE